MGIKCACVEKINKSVVYMDRENIKFDAGLKEENVKESRVNFEERAVIQ